MMCGWRHLRSAKWESIRNWNASCPHTSKINEALRSGIILLVESVRLYPHFVNMKKTTNGSGSQSHIWCLQNRSEIKMLLLYPWTSLNMLYNIRCAASVWMSTLSKNVTMTTCRHSCVCWRCYHRYSCRRVIVTHNDETLFIGAAFASELSTSWTSTLSLWATYRKQIVLRVQYTATSKQSRLTDD